MKILQLVNRIPYPLNDGGNLAVHFYMEGFLNAGVSLGMLAMNTTKHWVDINKLPPIFKQLDYFETVKVDNRVRLAAAFFNLFSNKSYNISRFENKNYERVLSNLLQSQTFDIVQIEGLFLIPYLPVIRKYSKAKIVLRQHNAEYLIWERLAAKEPSFLKKQYLKLLSKRLKSYETKALNKVDLLLPISETDAQIFKSLGAIKPIFVQSFGLDTSKVHFSPAFKPPLSIYHLGAMDWMPNQEAIQYFIEECLPILTNALPNIQIHLAGRKMPEYFFRLPSKNIIVHGEVKEATAFEKDKSILIVPLRSGGGVRIKIFRAMAMGKAVVATTIGMEGINIRNGIEAFVVKDAKEMAEKIMDLLQHPERVSKMGKAARQFMEQHHNQTKMIQELLAAYEKMISR